MKESTQAIAERIARRLQERLKAKDSKALKKLVAEIEIALSDEREGRQTALGCLEGPRGASVAPTPPAALERALQKVAEGQPLSGEEEDAILFGDLDLGHM